MRCCNEKMSRQITQRAQSAQPVEAVACCPLSLRSLRSLAAISLLSLSLCAAGATTNVPLFHVNLKAASEAAVADQSLVLLIFSADWCVPCKQLKAKTLDSREFKEQGGALHIAELDVDVQANAARDFNVTAVPTLVLMTGDDKIVARQEGYMATAELLLWLREGRDLVKEGKWEGTAPGSKLRALTAKAASDTLDTNDIARLVAMLGETDPAERQSAQSLLIEQKEAAVAPLIEALTNSYLGVRIAASEALDQLLRLGERPGAPSDAATERAKFAASPPVLSIDPWLSPAELATSAATLQKWWATTGKLPSLPQDSSSASAAQSGGAKGISSIAEALDVLCGNSQRRTGETLRDDPSRRTRAMSLLASRGAEALPAIRQAIKTCEKNGDQRSLTLLEDVRWAILIPDALEQQTGGVRSALARGRGQERQTAAARLGGAGRQGFPALQELANDADPLVVESAVRAISSIGGPDTIPAMATLLRATDSNLRMTAAQGLGHTKNPAAVKELISVLDDPNEVVVCTAISGLEEIHGEHESSSGKGPQLGETDGIRRCLSDPRWRVRAAAAEAAGKLALAGLTSELKALLDDQDGFVVKSALSALQLLGAAPEPEKLLDLAQRYPGLRGEAVEQLVAVGSDQSAKLVTDLYRVSDIETRKTIIRSLAGAKLESGVAPMVALGGGSFVSAYTQHDLTSGSADVRQPPRNQETNSWYWLLSQAATDPDSRLRQAFVETLAAQLPKTAAAFVGPLLSDPDEKTRAAAAGVVLAILSGERQRVRSAHGSRLASWVAMQEEETFLEEGGMQAGLLHGSRSKSKATNQPPATAEQIAGWHIALEKQGGKEPDLITAAAIYATGSSNADLPVLQAALERCARGDLGKIADAPVLVAIVPKLPWPQAKGIVERLCSNPGAYLQMISVAKKAAPGLSDFLFDPVLFRTAVDPAAPEVLETELPRLVEHGAKGWSLLATEPRTDAILAALIEATNPVWRATAIYSLSLRGDPKNLAQLERGLSDSNAWVRAAAVSGLPRLIKDREALEKRIASFLDDPDKRVGQRAVIGLLEQEVRVAAGLESQAGYFEFEKIRTWSAYDYQPGNEQRPLETIQANPAWLASVRRKAGATPPAGAEPAASSTNATASKSESDDPAMPALLLAQYGDFSGLDVLIKATPADGRGDNQLEQVILTCIALSRDAKYLPFLQKMVSSAKDEQELRRILQALKGMSGAEPRELRLAVNKRIREGKE
ncbi:MAG: hypothetical protein C5B50_10105 [Verrucomicrobia bacterium]|nr:MAG: hypothetical protein C5B50_10105 [Verrucomicrobiota bacterium]